MYILHPLYLLAFLLVIVCLNPSGEVPQGWGTEQCPCSGLPLMCEKLQGCSNKGSLAWSDVTRTPGIGLLVHEHSYRAHLCCSAQTAS